MNDIDEENWDSVKTIFTQEDEEDLLRALQYARKSGYHSQRSVDVAISMLQSSISAERGG